jgi:hypothetical protein
MKEGQVMSPRSKKEYRETIFLRYKKATRKVKSRILDEFCATCGYHRKHAIRVLKKFKRFTKPKPKKRGRRAVYRAEDIIRPLKRIWLAANLPCSKRLKAIISLWLPGYADTFGPPPLETIKALKKISSSTIDRILRPVRAHYTKHGRSTTKPGTLLRKHIPIRVNQWDESRPGYLEADTVAHCGESMAGLFAFTVDLVDIATGWTEQRAVWGKGETGVFEQIRDVEKKLPFAILGFDCDNGSEFLNYHLYKYFTKRNKPVAFTRSRAYHKDDNAHIEQKNWTHVRQWIGYDRLDHPGVVNVLNSLYTTEWGLFHNFFCPSVKLISKERKGSKTIKRHDSPKTPYQRIMASSFIELSVKEELSRQLENLNPFMLRKAIEIKLKKVFQLCYNNDHRMPAIDDILR